MAATFHVFVDGASDGSAQGLQKLAAAMASRYGLSPTDLVNRLAKGRFRVKANADRVTADKVAADLRSIGARVAVEEATAANATTGPVPKQPAPGTGPVPKQPGAGAAAGGAKPSPSALPPRTTGQVPKPGAPGTTGQVPKASASGTTGQVPKAAPPGSALSGVQRSAAPAVQPATGLAAAFSGDQPAASLGALESGALSLSALDGSDEAPPPIAAAPPPPPASSGAHAAQPAPAAKPLDLFAPPDMQEEAELAVTLAPEDEARHAARRASKPPPPSAPPALSTPTPAGSSRGLALAVDEPPVRNTPSTSLAPPVAAATPSTGGRVSIGIPAEWIPRARFAAGVLLSILLGFIPATLIGSAREHAAFASIDKRVEKFQAEATSPEAYATIDPYRADALDRKKTERRNAALIALVVWAIAGGGIAYVWFRRIPWKTA